MLASRWQFHQSGWHHGKTDLRWLSISETKELVSLPHLNTGVTPLMSACAGGSVAVVKYLLTLRGGNQDIDINSQTSDGRTVLHIATKTQFLDMIGQLIQHGADVNSQDTDGWTPLHLAARYKSSNEIELLIQHGADVNRQILMARLPCTLPLSTSHQSK